MPNIDNLRSHTTPISEEMMARIRELAAKDAPAPADVHQPGVDWPGRGEGRPDRRRRDRRQQPWMPGPGGGIVKADEDQHLVTGWASVIEHADGTPLVDRQGDVIEESELVKMAHDFMTRSRVAGEAHAEVKGIGRVVESVVFTRALKGALGLPQRFPTGWLITSYCENPATWDRIKAGEFTGYSIGGFGRREPLVAKATWR